MSVVIPCYNYARYLPQAVESVLSQTGVTVDIIVVDDASQDDSLSVARGLEAGEPRIRIVAHSTNLGPVDTFNHGMALARGDFLVRLDADDILTPGSLARSVALMHHYPSVGLVYGHPLHFAGESLPLPRGKATRWTIWPGQQWLRDRCRDAYNVITSPEVVMRNSVAQLTGGQRQLDHTHDMEMWLRLSAYSDVAYIHGADQAWHREHANSLSARKVDSYRDLVERRAAFELLFSEEIPVADADACRNNAMKAIAAQALEYASVEYDHGRDNQLLVRKLIELARATVPDVENVPGWKGLTKRMRLGPRRVAGRPMAALARGRRRLRRVLRERRWHRHGVL